MQRGGQIQVKKNTLGAYIRTLRLQNQMTQSQLAERLNVTDKAVSKWERDLAYPDIALFPKLADLLGVNVNDLLRESIGEGPPSRLAQIFEMSHDFRTPLHIILGCADMAETHYENEDRVRRYLQSIRVSGEYLLGIINKVMNTTHQEKTASAESDPNAVNLDDRLKKGTVGRQSLVGAYDFSGKRILIAEDMEINREIVGELLKQNGAEVDFAEDGRICLDKVIAAPADYYDLILMDVRMPNLDGIEATRRIRRLPNVRKASIPIIAVTANVYDKDRNAAIEAGMNAFTEKPISAEKLFEVMNRHLHGQK